MRSGKPYADIMLPLPQVALGRLRREAKGRGITVQELFRAVIIPAWFDRKHHGETVPVELDKLLFLIRKYPLNGRKPVTK